jgi:hypothetical protein
MNARLTPPANSFASVAGQCCVLAIFALLLRPVPWAELADVICLPDKYGFLPYGDVLPLEENGRTRCIDNQLVAENKQAAPKRRAQGAMCLDSGHIECPPHASLPNAADLKYDGPIYVGAFEPHDGALKHDFGGLFSLSSRDRDVVTLSE